MSKSRGNVVNPDDVIAEFGADAMLRFEMFIGPLAGRALVDGWNPGVARFLGRAYRLACEEDDAGDRVRELDPAPGPTRSAALARTIAQVTRDFGALEFNTAISA